MRSFLFSSRISFDNLREVREKIHAKNAKLCSSVNALSALIFATIVC